MRKREREKTASSSGCIRRDEVYALDAFRAITGLGDFAMRSARRNGLRVRYVGNRGFVLGSDFMAYLDKLDHSTEG